MFFKPPIKLISILFPIIIFSLICGCDQSQKEVDEYLDEFEEVVEKWESKLKSGKISALDLEEYEKDGARIETRGEELESEPSSSQLDRAEKLTKRLAVVMEEIMTQVVKAALQVDFEALGLDNLITWELDDSQMVLIPPGIFEMGNDSDDGDLNEFPAHEVELDGFYMDKFEVTNAQYDKFVRATGHRRPSRDDYYNEPNQPVVGVSWNDATAYAEWAEKRLPTEAEWEYAARGGLEGKRYPWGDKEPDGSQANYADKNADQTLRQLDKTYTWADMSVEDGYARCAPVGSFTPNGYGLYDIAGNAYEWCQDWYDGNYYSVSPAKNPSGPSTGEYRVLRGGSWFHNTGFLRLADRNHYNPPYRYNYVGFRCVSGSN